MKNTNALKSVVFFLFISFHFQTLSSQDLAQSVALKPYAKMYAMSNNIVIKNAILEDGKYTYKFKKREILVEIKNGFYYEYHPKKEFIKAKIDWVTEYQYNLTIVDLEIRGAPFKVGSKLTATITQIKGNQYFYKSTFNNKTGNGSFKKVK